MGGSFFQQKISDDFNKQEPSPAAIEHKRQNPPQAHSDQASKRRQAKLVVATLIATVTFTAALTPPGGFKTDGTPVLFENYYYKVFQLFNQLSFILAIIAIYNESTPIRLFSIELATPASLIRYSIGGLVVAFVSGTTATVQKNLHRPGPFYIFLAVISWLVLAFALISMVMSVYGKVGNRGFAVIRMVVSLFRKVGNRGSNANRIIYKCLL